MYRRLSKSDVLKVSETAPKEAILIEIKLARNKKMLFSLVYRSPNSNENENNLVNDFFRKIGNMQSYHHKIVVGDFNRKNIDWDKISSTSKDDQDFIEAVRDSFLTQHVKEPTRGRSGNEPSLLDLIFSRSDQDMKSINLEQPLGKSDHALIKMQYQCQPESLPDRVISDFRRADFEKMRDKLSIDWQTYLEGSGDDIDAIWEKFLGKFKEAESECIPKKIIKVRKKKFTCALDKKTLRTRKKKYRLWKRFMESQDAKVYEDYCKCRNQLRRKTRNAIKAREKEIAKHVKSNSKVFWAYVNAKTKLRSSIPDLWMEGNDGEKVRTPNDREKAQVLGKFFSSVFVQEPDGEWYLNNLNNVERTRLQVILTENVVLEKLKALDPSKSPGPDALHP